MLVHIAISEKSFGDKILYHDLNFDIQAGEKIGLIGRNGTGKSTLLHMITGDDTDYQGEITIKRGITLIASRQEHHGLDNHTVIEYIQGDLPEFAKLHHIISTYPAEMGESTRKIQAYSDALEQFNHLGYFDIENQLTQTFQDYQLDPGLLDVPFTNLSGGQKRMVELIKVQRARAHVTLIDEPTNHMDYVAKQAFVKWLDGNTEAVMVVTHDRDVLAHVDKIIEVRDGRAYSYKGNYLQYLKTNTVHITTQVTEFDLIQRRIANLENDLIRFRRLKEKARDPGTIKRFKSQEEKVETELERLTQTVRPSLWIDRESAGDLTPKLTTAYQKYKASNIKLDTAGAASETSRLLVQANNLSLSYTDSPLFSPIDFSLREGQRLRLHGRNGAGKTTLVTAITNKVNGQSLEAHIITGNLAVDRDMQLGRYEQEIDEHFLPMKLKDAIEQSLMERNELTNDQRIKQLLSEYLFNPITDGEMPISRLSGGQKARFQLIRMLLGNPNLLILDEPTNHLDLPSIEELEDALADYHGAVIYISHDSYFASKVGGDTIHIGN